MIDEELFRFFAGIKLHFEVRELLADLGKHQVHDRGKIGSGERMEDDDLIDTVDEFRTERVFHFIHHQLLHILEGFLLLAFVLCFESQFLHLVFQEGRAKVTGHDDDSIREVHGAALTIGQTTIIEYLQKNIEEIRMRLFDFIEEDDAVRRLSHGIGQLAAFFIADISWRRTDETGHFVFLHVFRHIETNHIFLTAKHAFSERSGQLGLADTGRAEEEEGTDRTFRILHAGTRTTDRRGNGMDSLILTDHSLMQLFFQMEQALGVALLQILQRYPRPFSDDFCHIFFRDFKIIMIRPLPVLLHEGDLTLHLLGSITILGGFFKILRSHSRFLFFQKGGQLFFLLFQRIRCRRRFHADLGGGFIDDIDGFIRLETIRDVTTGKFDSRFHCFIGDLCFMKGFVAITQTLQDLQRIFRCRFTDFDRLEATFQSSILFDILLIFFQSGRTDAAQLPACQSRFHDIGCIHGAFRRACSHQCMQFIDEKDPVFMFLHFINDFFQPFLKFASVLGTGDDGGHIERNHMAVLQDLRHIMRNDPLCKPFCDGCLAYARLTDEDRVVLISAGQDLDHTIDLRLTPDDRVDLALFGFFIEVDGKITHLSQLCTAFSISVFRNIGIEGFLQLLLCHAEMLQDLHRNAAAFPKNGKQQMLRADEGIAKIIGFLHRHFQHPFRPRRYIQLTTREEAALPLTGEQRLHRLYGHSERIQDLAAGRIFFVGNAQKQMLGPQIITAQLRSLFSCKFPGIFYTICISVFHRNPSFVLGFILNEKLEMKVVFQSPVTHFFPSIALILSLTSQARSKSSRSTQLLSSLRKACSSLLSAGASAFSLAFGSLTGISFFPFWNDGRMDSLKRS